MISFNFSKKKENKKLEDSKLRDESTLDDKDDKDFVVSVQGNEIKGTKKKEEKKELVIPLICKNEWRVDGGSSKRFIPPSESPPGSPRSDTVKVKVEEESKDDVGDLEKQAIKELLNDKSSDVRKNGSNVPLLLQNQIPNGFEEDDNMDVSLRPDQSTMDDYEKIPIEEFGLAMLRGMGWKKTEGIGLTNKKNIEMLEPQLRPKGLGLGAERPKTNKDVGPSSVPQEEEEELRFKLGAGAMITKGPDKGMYGRIESFDEDINRVIIKLAINKKMSTVSKFHITLVSEKEFDKKSKVLNYDQYDEYKKKHDEKDRKHREAEDSRKRDRESSPDAKRSKKDSSSYKSSKYDDSMDKKSKRYEDRDGYTQKSSSSTNNHTERQWVRPNLKVRFIDKKYKQGKYYEKKFVVEDVVEVDNFVLRVEHGNSVIEGICTSQLETVIPREAHTPICILHGKRKGQVGVLVEKNRKKETAVVKLPDASVLELRYDDLCEFVGDPEDYY